MLRYTVIGLALSLIETTYASYAGETSHSKYSGQQTRKIKSLSQDDIRELRRGGGWGLAKAAELNGIPGPAHLLELKKEINLSAEQVAEITEIYERMKEAAIRKGEELIQLEQRLESEFVNRNLNEARLKKLLTEIALVRGDLRLIHLSTHLKTPALLHSSQIKKYNELRGYKVDPCKSIPKNHEPVMWRKHNGCS